MALVTLDMSPLGKRVNFTTLLGLTITLFLVLFQAPAAQASNEISIFLVSKNKNATVEDALLSVPIFGKVLGDKLENQTLIIQQKKEENVIFFLGSAKAFPKTKTELSVVSANTEYRFNIPSKAFKKRRADSDSAWKTINLIELYNNDEIKKLLEEAANLKEQLEQTNNEAIESQNKRTELEQNLADLQLELKLSQDQYENANVELAETALELERIRKEKSEVSDANTKRVVELEDLSSSLSMTINYQKDEIQALKLQLVNYENQKKLDDKKTKKNDAQLQLLEKELSLQTTLVDELKAELSAKEKLESGRGAEEIKQLKSSLAKKAKETEQLQNKIDDLTGQITDFVSTNKKLVGDLATAQSRGSANAEVTSLNSRVESLIAELEVVKSDLKRAEDKNLQLTQAIAALASGDSQAAGQQSSSSEISKKVYSCTGAYWGQTLVGEGLNLSFASRKTEFNDVLILDFQEKTAKLGPEIQDGIITEVTDEKVAIEDKYDGSKHELNLISGDIKMPVGSVITRWKLNCTPKEKL